MRLPGWLQRFFEWQGGDGERMACIASNADEVEASIWRDALAMEGIEVEFRGSDSGIPPYSNLGRRSLWVPESQALRARRIIEHGRGETERRRRRRR